MKTLLTLAFILTSFAAHAGPNDRVVLYDYHQDRQTEQSCIDSGGIPMTDSETHEMVNCMPGKADRDLNDFGYMRSVHQGHTTFTITSDQYKFCSQYVLDNRDQGSNVVAYEQCKSVFAFFTIPVN